MAHERQERLLTAVEIDVELARLSHWSYDSGRRALYRRVELSDFAAVFGLMARIAIAADKVDHHPEWANVYNRLDVWLTTHDVDGVSPRDVALAEMIDGFKG